MAALCERFDDARLALWRAVGPAMLDALDLVPDATDDEVRITGRLADSAFKLSRPLAVTPASRAALTRAKNLRDRVTLATMGLAVAYAKTHRGATHGSGRGLTLEARGDDALQQALEYLLKAVDRYDPRRGVKFSTYASHWIRRGVQEARLAATPVKLTLGALTRWGASEDAEAALACELGREPDEAEIAERVGSERKLATARAVARVLRPCDYSIGEGIHGDEIDLPAPGDSPEDALIERETREQLRASIDRALPPGSRQRIVAEVVADGGRLADAGAAVGRRRTSVRQDLRAARDALREVVDPDLRSPVLRRRRR